MLLIKKKVEWYTFMSFLHHKSACRTISNICICLLEHSSQLKILGLELHACNSFQQKNHIWKLETTFLYKMLNEN